MRFWITLTHNSFLAISPFFLVLGLGCDVYSPGFLEDGGQSDTSGCARGTADCDDNGSCESDLSSEATCGSCANRCTGSEMCVASTICVGGDGSTDAQFDVMNPDAEPDVPPAICGSVLPERPPVTGGDDIGSQVWALKDVVLDQSGGLWQDIGWNLDERCTNDITDDHLCTPPDEPVPPLDGPLGVDNSFGENILSQVTMFNSAFQANARQDMEEGRVLLVSMRHWNGEDNDDDVEITLLEGLGVQGGGFPEWDGTDRFIQSDTSFIGGNPDVPAIRDTRAFVANRRFVAVIPPLRPITLPWVQGNSFDLKLSDANLSGIISEDGQRLEDVWITGRYALVDLAATWEAAGLCPGGTLRGLIDIAVNRDLDVRSVKGSGGLGAECDAISVALEFTGYIGALGDVQTPPPPDPVSCLP